MEIGDASIPGEPMKLVINLGFHALHSIECVVFKYPSASAYIVGDIVVFCLFLYILP